MLVSWQNEYAMNQNFQQVYQAIEDQLNGMKEVSAFLLANGNIQETFQKNAMEGGLEQFAALEESRKIFLDSNAVDEITFYLDASYPIAGKSAGNKYRDIRILGGEDWYQQMEAGKRWDYWGILYSDTSMFMDQYVSYVHVISELNDYTKMKGLLCISLNRRKIEELMIPVLEGQQFLIQSGSAVLLGDAVFFTEPVQSMGGEVKYDGESWYCISRELDGTGLELVSMIPKCILTRQTFESVGIMIAIFVVLVIVVCWICIMLANTLSARIVRLAETCRQSENGIVIKAEEEEAKDEIGELYRAYNHMADRITFLMEEQYRIGEEVKDAQLKALQAQINPHFLYNTLEMISWMVKKEDVKSVQAVIRSLTRYYRSVLNKGADEIDIMDEIQMGIAYMEIQNCRFKGKIHFIFESEELEHMAVPKLILQPLLENAIFHGVVKKEDGRGTIWLKAYHRDTNIILEVSDDGVGFGCDAYKNTEGGNGSRYGIENIRNRIALFFQKDADLTIESTPGIGTSIYIRIPLRDVETRSE